jgi:hypothetical protein
VIAVVVAPVDQRTVPSQPVAESVTLPPGHICDVVQVIVGGVGGGANVTVAEPVAEFVQLAAGQVAVYVVVADTVTLIVLPVAPLLHVTPEAQPEAVSDTGVPAHTLVLLAVTVIVGVVAGFTVTVTPCESPELQLSEVHLAVYVVVAVAVTLIEAPVCPLDHVTVPEQLVADNLTTSPEQTVGLSADIIGGVPPSPISTVTSLDLLERQVADSQTAENVVLASIGTVIDAPVEPLDHLTVPLQPDAVSVTLAPRQTLLADAATVGAAKLLTTTVRVLDLVDSQSPFLQVAVYSVVEEGVTLIEAPVCPLDHVIVPSQPVADNDTGLPAQILVALAVTAGAVG